MKHHKRAIVVALVLALVALPVMAAQYSPARYSQDEAALSWIRQAQESDGGFSSGFSEGSDFGTTVEVILAAVAAGQDVSTWQTPSGASPLDYVASQVAAGQISDAGNLARAILVAVATGQDPRAFAGSDLVAMLLQTQDETTGMFGDTLFKHAYALLALHAAGEPIPESAVTLLTSQFTEDGAWALFGGTTPGTADTNTTAMVMQALVAAGRPDAAAGALPYLQRMQNDDGGFPYQNPSPWGTDTDANSTALVLQALRALGEPMGNWAASGTDPVGALLALWDETSGGYFWQAAVPFPNMLSTAQAIQALEGMTLVTLPQVGAAYPPTVAATAPDAILLPVSGGKAMGPVMVSVGVLLLGSWALLRRTSQDS